MKLRTAAAIAFVLVTLATPAMTQSTLYSVVGSGAGDMLGNSVDGAGDVDGDGVPDSISGAYRADPGGFMSGAAFVFSGATGAVIHAFDGQAVGHQFGRDVSGAGDVDGDGYADLVIGAPGTDLLGQDSGSAFVFSGRTGAQLHAFHGHEPGINFATAVAGMGDMNSDGYDDIAIGARLRDGVAGSRAGAVFVYSGFDGALLLTLEGENEDDQFGHSIDGAGDVNSDGFADLIVGAYLTDFNGNMSGSAYVISGCDSSILYRFDGDADRDWFGIAVSGCGDVDFDGLDDVIVGAMWNDAFGHDAGMARVFSGLDGSTIHTFYGESNLDYFGCAVAGIGDVDGDGFADIGIGAYGDDNIVSNAGAVTIFSGFDGTTMHRFDGATTNELFGQAIAGAGDVDGDGLYDIMIGAAGVDVAGPDHGYVVVTDIGGTAQPGIERIHGAGCVGGLDRLPRMHVAGSADTGRSLIVSLWGARPNALIALHVGHQITLSLDSFGMAGCTSYVDPVAAFQFTSNSIGYLRSPLFVPNNPAIAGLQLGFQWAVDDPSAPHAIGVALSNALDVTVGN